MAGPTDLEQLLIEYINDARLDPMGNAARYIASYSPLIANDSEIQAALSFFGVDGSMLLSQFSALVPVEPVAWNESLGIAARRHTDRMIAADTQSHQLPGEADLGTRNAAAGYTNFSQLGENVYAFAESAIEAQAGFMVDWGPGPGGMQTPPGHRINIMDADFREVGVGIKPENNFLSSVGPLVVTEEFGARFNSGVFILGTAYNDADHDNFYSLGEGLGTLNVAVGSLNVTSWASGGFTLNTPATGMGTVIFSGAGLAEPVNAVVNLAANSNVMFEIVNGATLETSTSVSVSGPISTLEGLGLTGLSLSTPDGTAHAILGTPANDTITGGSGADTLTGGRGNDLIDGGGGSDGAVFAGLRSGYTLSALGGNGVQVSGADGVDTLANIERLVFADQTVSWGATEGLLITLGPNPQTVIGAAGDTIVGGGGTALINAIAGPESIIGGAGSTTVWGGVNDSITGGAGALLVAGNAASGMTIIGGSGDLSAFNLGTASSVTGSASGFTFVDDNYGGGGNTIVGGAGKGPVTTPLGSTVAAGSFIIGGRSDVITAGAGPMLVNALNGAMTINGGAGSTTVWGAAGNKVTAGSGVMLLDGDSQTITGGTGSVLVVGGSSNSVIAELGSATVTGGTGNTVTGGAGFLQFNVGSRSTVTGGAGSLAATDLGTGNSVVGSSSGITFIDDSYSSTTTGAFTGGTNTLVGGAGNSTITAGPGDSIIGGAGALEAIIRSNLTGAETVNLSAGGTKDGVRDISVAGGLGAKVTVTGFNTVDDRIESATSRGSVLIATATTDGGGNVVLHFVDNSTMTLVGVTDVAKIIFTG